MKLIREILIVGTELVIEKNDMTTSKYISETSKEYSIYVAETRAIPRATDGLKDGQRKALYLMQGKADKIKTVALAGSLIAEEIYNHGDTSASETISALAAPFINNVCFLDGIGTFGSKISPKAWGASRYTYVKRNSAAQDILYADFDIAPYVDNYDGSKQSPETFLPLIPTVLLNGVSGIAVGWSTEILPHKLTDIVDSCLQAIDEKKIKPIKPHYQNYDVTVTNIENNSWSLNGKVSIVDHNTVKISEIPPNLKLEKLKEHLDELEEQEKIQGYIDKSVKTIDIVVQFKRGATKDYTEDSLVDLFKLKSRVTQRIVVIDWSGQGIKTYEKPELLVKDFVEWRLGWFEKRYQNLLKLTQSDLNYANAIKACFDKGLPDDLREYANKQQLVEAVNTITLKFKLDTNQINQIVSMPSYKWTKDNYQIILDDIKKYTDLTKEYKDILADKQKIKDIYKNELLTIRKKHG